MEAQDEEALNRLLNETTEYLNEVQYPAHKRDLVAAAEARDAPKPVLAVLKQLPDKTYTSHNDLVALFVDTKRRPSRGQGRKLKLGVFPDLSDYW